MDAMTPEEVAKRIIEERHLTPRQRDERRLKIIKRRREAIEQGLELQQIEEEYNDIR